MERPRGRYFERADDALRTTPYDFVIVGAGVYGLCLGYFLRQLAPDASVLIVEDNTIPGDGITINTGGIVRSCYSDPDVCVVSAFGQPYFANPTETMDLRREVTTGFVPSGWIRAVSETATPGIRDELDRIVETARSQGIDGVWSAGLAEYLDTVDPSRRSNLAKIFTLEDVTHVLVDDYGGYADGGTTLLAFLEACLDHGVDVARQCTVTGFLRDGSSISGIRFERWRMAGAARESIASGELAAGAVVVAAGAGSRRLIERECGIRMPTFPTFHQTPMVQSTPGFVFDTKTYRRTVEDPDGATRTFDVETVDLPVVSHWRDLYFHSEGAGVTVGAHHRELHDEDFVPQGGRVGDGDGAIEVGLSQVLVDKIIENMDFFPALAGDGLRLGSRPDDVPGGFYVMNPEELPFEGAVPGNEGLYYIGSGSGTGFKLGPGLSYLLAQRLVGVPVEERLIAGPTLSVERNDYFYPADTTEETLLALFAAEGGRFRHVGASGIGVGSEA